MTLQQALAFAVIIGMMALFVWGRLRYDLVAVLTLLVAIAVGIVPYDKAFSGFSDDIVIIVASALLVSGAVARSGLIERALRRFGSRLKSTNSQVLVLTGSREPRRGAAVSEADLLRSRVLCDAADSVFALGQHASCPHQFYLLQTRSRYTIRWNASNAPHCRLVQFKDGFLSFEFDERFLLQVIDGVPQETGFDTVGRLPWASSLGISFGGSRYLDLHAGAFAFHNLGGDLRVCYLTSRKRR